MSKILALKTVKFTQISWPHPLSAPIVLDAAQLKFNVTEMLAFLDEAVRFLVTKPDVSLTLKLAMPSWTVAEETAIVNKARTMPAAFQIELPMHSSAPAQLTSGNAYYLSLIQRAKKENQGRLKLYLNGNSVELGGLESFVELLVNEPDIACVNFSLPRGMTLGKLFKLLAERTSFIDHYVQAKFELSECTVVFDDAHPPVNLLPELELCRGLFYEAVCMKSRVELNCPNTLNAAGRDLDRNHIDILIAHWKHSKTLDKLTALDLSRNKLTIYEICKFITFLEDYPDIIRVDLRRNDWTDWTGPNQVSKLADLSESLKWLTGFINTELGDIRRLTRTSVAAHELFLLLPKELLQRVVFSLPRDRMRIGTEIMSRWTPIDRRRTSDLISKLAFKAASSIPADAQNKRFDELLDNLKDKKDHVVVDARDLLMGREQLERIVPHLKQCPKLCVLYLSGNQIDDPIAEYLLSELRSCEQLLHIDLSRNPLVNHPAIIDSRIGDTPQIEYSPYTSERGIELLSNLGLLDKRGAMVEGSFTRYLSQDPQASLEGRSSRTDIFLTEYDSTSQLFIDELTSRYDHSLLALKYQQIEIQSHRTGLIIIERSEPYFQYVHRMCLLLPLVKVGNSYAFNERIAGRTELPKLADTDCSLHIEPNILYLTIGGIRLSINPNGDSKVHKFEFGQAPMVDIPQAALPPQTNPIANTNISPSPTLSPSETTRQTAIPNSVPTRQLAIDTSSGPSAELRSTQAAASAHTRSEGIANPTAPAELPAAHSTQSSPNSETAVATRSSVQPASNVGIPPSANPSETESVGPVANETPQQQRVMFCFQFSSMGVFENKVPMTADVLRVKMNHKLCLDSKIILRHHVNAGVGIFDTNFFDLTTTQAVNNTSVQTSAAQARQAPLNQDLRATNEIKASVFGRIAVYAIQNAQLGGHICVIDKMECQADVLTTSSDLNLYGAGALIMLKAGMTLNLSGMIQAKLAQLRGNQLLRIQTDCRISAELTHCISHGLMIPHGTVTGSLKQSNPNDENIEYLLNFGSYVDMVGTAITILGGPLVGLPAQVAGTCIRGVSQIGISYLNFIDLVQKTKQRRLTWFELAKVVARAVLPGAQYNFGLDSVEARGLKLLTQLMDRDGSQAGDIRAGLTAFSLLNTGALAVFEGMDRSNKWTDRLLSCAETSNQWSPLLEMAYTPMVLELAIESLRNDKTPAESLLNERRQETAFAYFNFAIGRQALANAMSYLPEHSHAYILGQIVEFILDGSLPVNLIQSGTPALVIPKVADLNASHYDLTIKTVISLAYNAQFRPKRLTDKSIESVRFGMHLAHAFYQHKIELKRLYKAYQSKGVSRLFNELKSLLGAYRKPEVILARLNHLSSFEDVKALRTLVLGLSDLIMPRLPGVSSEHIELMTKATDFFKGQSLNSWFSSHAQTEIDHGSVRAFAALKGSHATYRSYDAQLNIAYKLQVDTFRRYRDKGVISLQYHGPHTGATFTAGTNSFFAARLSSSSKTRIRANSIDMTQGTYRGTQIEITSMGLSAPLLDANRFQQMAHVILNQHDIDDDFNYSYAGLSLNLRNTQPRTILYKQEFDGNNWFQINRANTSYQFQNGIKGYIVNILQARRIEIPHGKLQLLGGGRLQASEGVFIATADEQIRMLETGETYIYRAASKVDGIYAHARLEIDSPLLVSNGVAFIHSLIMPLDSIIKNIGQIQLMAPSRVGFIHNDHFQQLFISAIRTRCIFDMYTVREFEHYQIESNRATSSQGHFGYTSLECAGGYNHGLMTGEELFHHQPLEAESVIEFRREGAIYTDKPGLAYGEKILNFTTTMIEQHVAKIYSDIQGVGGLVNNNARLIGQKIIERDFEKAANGHTPNLVLAAPPPPRPERAVLTANSDDPFILPDPVFPERFVGRLPYATERDVLPDVILSDEDIVELNPHRYDTSAENYLCDQAMVGEIDRGYHGRMSARDSLREAAVRYAIQLPQNAACLNEWGGMRPDFVLRINSEQLAQAPAAMIIYQAYAPSSRTLVQSLAIPPALRDPRLLRRGALTHAQVVVMSSDIAGSRIDNTAFITANEFGFLHADFVTNQRLKTDQLVLAHINRKSGWGYARIEIAQEGGEIAFYDGCISTKHYSSVGGKAQRTRPAQPGSLLDVPESLDELVPFILAENSMRFLPLECSRFEQGEITRKGVNYAIIPVLYPSEILSADEMVLISKGTFDAYGFKLQSARYAAIISYQAAVIRQAEKSYEAARTCRRNGFRSKSEGGRSSVLAMATTQTGGPIIVISYDSLEWTVAAYAGADSLLYGKNLLKVSSAIETQMRWQHRSGFEGFNFGKTDSRQDYTYAHRSLFAINGSLTLHSENELDIQGVIYGLMNNLIERARNRVETNAVEHTSNTYSSASFSLEQAGLRIAQAASKGNLKATLDAIFDEIPGYQAAKQATRSESYQAESAINALTAAVELYQGLERYAEGDTLSSIMNLTSAPGLGRSRSRYTSSSSRVLPNVYRIGGQHFIDVDYSTTHALIDYIARSARWQARYYIKILATYNVALQTSHSLKHTIHIKPDSVNFRQAHSSSSQEHHQANTNTLQVSDSLSIEVSDPNGCIEIENTVGSAPRGELIAANVLVTLQQSKHHTRQMTKSFGLTLALDGSIKPEAQREKQSQDARVSDVQNRLEFASLKLVTNLLTNTASVLKGQNLQTQTFDEYHSFRAQSDTSSPLQYYRNHQTSQHEPYLAASQQGLTALKAQAQQAHQPLIIWQQNAKRELVNPMGQSYADVPQAPLHFVQGPEGNLTPLAPSSAPQIQVKMIGVPLRNETSSKKQGIKLALPDANKGLDTGCKYLEGEQSQTSLQLPIVDYDNISGEHSFQNMSHDANQLSIQTQNYERSFGMMQVSLNRDKIDKTAEKYGFRQAPEIAEISSTAPTADVSVAETHTRNAPAQTSAAPLESEEKRDDSYDVGAQLVKHFAENADVATPIPALYTEPSNRALNPPAPETGLMGPSPTTNSAKGSTLTITPSSIDNPLTTPASQADRANDDALHASLFPNSAYRYVESLALSPAAGNSLDPKVVNKPNQAPLIPRSQPSELHEEKGKPDEARSTKRVPFKLSSRLPQSHPNPVMNHAFALGRGIEKGRDAVADMVLHPIETAENLGLLAWDGGGVWLKMLLDKPMSEPMAARFKERTEAFRHIIEAYEGGDSVVKLELLTTLVTQGLLSHAAIKGAQGLSELGSQSLAELILDRADKSGQLAKWQQGFDSAMSKPTNPMNTPNGLSGPVAGKPPQLVAPNVKGATPLAPGLPKPTGPSKPPNLPPLGPSKPVTVNKLPKPGGVTQSNRPATTLPRPTHSSTSEGAAVSLASTLSPSEQHWSQMSSSSCQPLPHQSNKSNSLHQHPPHASTPQASSQLPSYQPASRNSPAPRMLTRYSKSTSATSSLTSSATQASDYLSPSQYRADVRRARPTAQERNGLKDTPSTYHATSTHVPLSDIYNPNLTNLPQQGSPLKGNEAQLDGLLARLSQSQTSLSTSSCSSTLSLQSDSSYAELQQATRAFSRELFRAPVSLPMLHTQAMNSTNAQRSVTKLEEKQKFDTPAQSSQILEAMPWKPPSFREKIRNKLDAMTVSQLKDFVTTTYSWVNTEQLDCQLLDSTINKIAAEIYERIRTTRYNFTKVAKTCKFTIIQLNRIYLHLFHKDHILLDKVGRFDPDYIIARAWDNLMSGALEGYENQLFEHEDYESWYEIENNSDYLTAHQAANEAGFTSGLNPREEALHHKGMSKSTSKLESIKSYFSSF